MSKTSKKNNKTIYQSYREENGFTRESASEEMEQKYNYALSADRLYKLENGKAQLNPEDVLAMSKCYNTPELCNYYCSHECPIGQQYVPEVQMKELSQIVLETLNSLNTIEKQKNRFIEITVDGLISDDEYEDFVTIKNNLRQIANSIDSLQLWINKAIAEGKCPEDV